ncbi:hypothetical protein [Streptomyces sp. NPDC002573]|uniref:hypothetical protein n=1 Tax=Streptomyces sp. NPDC002573 TaxID=3364651 RepID=UPI0036BF6BF7
MHCVPASWAGAGGRRCRAGRRHERGRRDRDYAATTRERNVGILNLHIMPTFNAMPLHTITTPQVRRWRTGLLDAGVGPATVAKAYTILRTILKTAVDDGLIQQPVPDQGRGYGHPRRAALPLRARGVPARGRRSAPLPRPRSHGGLLRAPLR